LHSQRDKKQIELQNVCCRAVQNILSYPVLFKNVRIILVMYRSFIVAAVVLGCDIGVLQWEKNIGWGV